MRPDNGAVLAHVVVMKAIAGEVLGIEPVFAGSCRVSARREKSPPLKSRSRRTVP